MLLPEVEGLVEAVPDKPGERESGLLLATAVAISSFVALMLVPEIAARLTQAQQPDGAVTGRIKALGGDWPLSTNADWASPCGTGPVV